MYHKYVYLAWLKQEAFNVWEEALVNWKIHPTQHNSLKNPNKWDITNNSFINSSVHFLSDICCMLVLYRIVF